MTYILALDQGTTSSRALILNASGMVVSSSQKEFKQYFPAPGFVEHSAEEIWSSQISVAHEALAKAKLNAADIAAIGITNQRETTIIWDKKTGIPIAPAIVWQDRRTTPLCQSLKPFESKFIEKTGLLLDPYFSGTKIRWILDHVKGTRDQKTLAFGTVDSWLIWNLSGGKLHITDATNASRTLLYNIHTNKWDEELLDILQIPASILPTVKSSSEVYGLTGEHVFSKPIPIAAIAGDQQAALVGQGCFEAGTAKSTYGTGCFILMNTGEKPVLSKNKLLTTIALQMDGKTSYALEGSVFIAGAAVQWLRDNLGIIKKSSDIEELASSVPDSGGVCFVPAFTGLGAPYWDPHARGTILGLSRGTTKAHIARALLESIALSASDVLKAMEDDSKIKLHDLRVDGGVVVSNLLMQFQADLLNIAVLRPTTKELTALGAAFLAGLAVGVWKNKEELQSIWKLDRKFSPQMEEASRKKFLSTWKKAVVKAKGWDESE
jgi:glycerol kinase